MAVARMRKICVDAVDPVDLADFWGAVLDYRPAADVKGEAGLVDAEGEFRLWFNKAEHPKSVKNRVHLDIYARSLADLEELGAKVVLPEGDDRHWTVMADPEGGEFCAFLRDELPSRRLHGLVVDCSDAPAQARWWHDVLGGRFIDEGTWGTVADLPDLPGMTFDFVPVPEPKSGANRLHWDLDVEAVELLVERGATLLRAKGQDDLHWNVMADPEGNEFCAFTR